MLRRVGILGCVAACVAVSALGAARKFEIQGTMEPPGSAALLGLRHSSGRLLATTNSDVWDNFHFGNLREGAYTVFVVSLTRPYQPVTGMNVGPRTVPEVQVAGARIIGEAWTPVQVTKGTANSRGHVQIVVTIPPKSVSEAQEENTVPIGQVHAPRGRGPVQKPLPGVVEWWQGLFSLHGNNLKEPLQYFERFLDLAPRDLPASETNSNLMDEWNWAGVLTYYFGEYVKAEGAFRTAIATDPQGLDPRSFPTSSRR